MARVGLTALLIPVVFAGVLLPAPRVSVLVVSESGVPAYSEALGGVSAALPPGTFRIVDAGGKTFERDFAVAMENGESRVVIAVGSRALEEVRTHRPGVPIVAAMNACRAGSAEAGLAQGVPVAWIWISPSRPSWQP